MQNVLCPNTKFLFFPKITSFLLLTFSIIVEQISWAIFQGGGLWSTTFVSTYQNVRIGL